jgi:TonB-dependent receptor-like protein
VGLALRALSVGFVALAAASSVGATERAVAGRNIADVLREARTTDGIRVIFTDQLVPPDLQVAAEPRSRDALARLREILHARGLTLEEVSPFVYVVKRERAVRTALSAVTPTAAGETLAQVEVTASRYTVDSTSGGEPLRLVSAAIERQPALFDDVARSIRQFPGTAGQDVSSRTFVRGGVPEDNLVLLDGVPLYEPWHLHGLPLNFSVIDPVTIGRVDFYSGVVPVEYGNRMGALVNMHVRDPADTLSGRVSAGSLDASALASGPLPADKGDWMLFGRQGFFGRAVMAREWDIGHPQLVDGLGRARYRLHDGSLLTFGGLLAHDRADLGIATRFFDDSSAQTYAWAAYDRGGDRLHSRTTLSYTSIRSDRLGELGVLNSLGSLDDERRFRSAWLQQNWTVPLRESATMRWGAAIREERALFDRTRTLSIEQGVADFFHRPALSVSTTVAEVGLHEQELYWALNRSFGRRVTLDAGLHASRANYSTDQTAFAWDPRASVRFDLTPSTRLRLASGRMTQISSAAELPVERDRSQFDEPSISTQHVLSLEHDFGSRVSVRTEVFDRRIQDPRPRLENVLFPGAFLPELRADQLLIQPQSARMQGADLYATATFTEHLQAWLSYSHSTAVDVIDGRDVPRAWDQRHAAALGLTAEGRSWMVSAALYGHSNWPQTPLTLEAAGNSAPDIITSFLDERDSLERGRYLSLDVKAAYRLRFSRGSLHVSLEAANATNRTNLCCDDASFARLVDDEVVPLTDRRTWLPIMWYGTVSWEFGEDASR